MLCFSVSLYSSEFNDLESRIDQMLKRLNNLDSPKINPAKTPVPSPQTPVVIEIKSELPQINLPPLPNPKTTEDSSDVSKSLNQLESRIDSLLNRLDLNVKPHDTLPAPPRKESRPLPVISDHAVDYQAGSSFALPEKISEQDIKPPPLPKNRFNFYIGFSIPNDTTYSDSTGDHNIEFGNGYEIGFEYTRIFEDKSYIGAFIEGKFFDSESLSSALIDGDNRLINFGFTLGQDWTLSEHFAVKTQASIGASSAHYEITSENYSSTDLAFHYSFLLGLEVKWNEYWHTNLYYELDGRSSADRVDYQSFHQIGLEAGIGF